MTNEPCIYPAILVEHFNDDSRRRVADAGDRATDDDSVEDKHLIPCRAECLLNHLRALALIQEHDTSERI